MVDRRVGSVGERAARSPVVVRGRRGVVGQVPAAAGVVVGPGAAGRSGLRRRALVCLGVLAQGGRVRVGLVAARCATHVRLVGRVHVRVLLAVRAVGEATSATDELAPERSLTCTAQHTPTSVIFTVNCLLTIVIAENNKWPQ